MSIKVYLAYEGEPADGELVSERKGRESHKLKMTIPESWLSGPASKLLAFYCATYTKKYPDKPLVDAEMHIHCCGVTVPPGGEIGKFIQDYNDVFVRHNLKPKIVALPPAGSIVCTNFGCGKHFTEDNNAPDACHHHKGGPIFHDTYKYWSCCPGTKAMDWEDFEKIPTCAVGQHGTKNKPVVFSSNEVMNTPLTQEQVTQMAATAALAGRGGEGGDAQRRCGPREFEEALHAAKAAPQQVRPDGTASCRNFGCQKDFVVAENHDTACTYHREGPVFWDARKYWKCCPERKCDDFDDFVRVPGCTVGPHKL